METIFEKINKDNFQKNIVVFEKAANILKNNGLVAFPTETVYGLGANALKEEAVKKIYVAKGRPSDNPLIVHIAEIEDVLKIASNIPNIAFDLMEKFWAGALTIVLKKKDIIPKTTSGSLDTVAIRMPNNKIAINLIKECRFPIAAPSANLSGKPSPTKASHVFKDLNGKIEMIIDGGDCQIGLESTVVEVLEDRVNILRPGSITEEMLAKVCKNVFIDKAILEKNSKTLPKAPGMKYKHYSPKGEITIFKGETHNIAKKILSILQNDGKKSIAILTKETIEKYKEFVNYNILNIGSKENKQEIAKNLFAILRECDNLNMEKIYIEYFEEKGIGLAIMNRLEKAAGYNIINV